jgi:hypothetical protein
MCMFCRSVFVLLYFFFWPLCCLFIFDLQILSTPLVSANSSIHHRFLCFVVFAGFFVFFPFFYFCFVFCFLFFCFDVMRSLLPIFLLICVSCLSFFSVWCFQCSLFITPSPNVYFQDLTGYSLLLLNKYTAVLFFACLFVFGRVHSCCHCVMFCVYCLICHRSVFSV